MTYIIIFNFDLDPISSNSIRIFKMKLVAGTDAQENNAMVQT